MIRRREFITVLGGAAAWPLAARAQQPALPVVGFLGVGSPELFPNEFMAFRNGLTESGFIEGRNVTIDYRFAGNVADRLRELSGRSGPPSRDRHHDNDTRCSSRG